MESHLLQMRGLKPLSFTMTVIVHTSHLLQMRGLKQNESGKTATISLSHLLQMRGLKQKLIKTTFCLCSRIFYRCVD